jgi:glycosyltransferase involved in cell wall biosynthesis
MLLVLPVYNEEILLRDTVSKVRSYINTNSAALFPITILIADNGSTDQTHTLAIELAEEFSDVLYLRTEQKGRGYALQAAWNLQGYDVYAYIDADLAYDLQVILQIQRCYSDSGVNVVVGARRHQDSIVKRHWIRNFLTEGYNLLLKILFSNNFLDAQAGCKAISAGVRDRVLPLDAEGGWFFDTKLLILAERYGYVVTDIPIICIDRRGWRLNLINTILYFLNKTLTLRFQLWFGKQYN